MTDEELAAHIESYLDEQWETVVADIGTLVSVESVKDPATAGKGAPFGADPRRALDAALDIAARMGLSACDGEGYVGFADLPGESERQIAMICHVDVVPAGAGWTVEPFAVTRREGWLMGRGVLDDKGPAMVALHAVNCLKQAGERLPYTLRMLFGTDEESGMKDVPHYLERHEAPAFLFTPDADFPVGYGEKGQFDGVFRAPVQEGGAIVELEGGMATNAVPSQASALLRADAAQLPAAEGVVVSEEPDGVRVLAHGVGGHAAWPEQAHSAFAVLADYLLEAGVGTAVERAFLQLVATLSRDVHGEAAGIAAQDRHFGPLTLAAGTLRTVPAEAEAGSRAVGAGYRTAGVVANAACKGSSMADADPQTKGGGLNTAGDGLRAGAEGARSGAKAFALTVDVRFPTTTDADEVAAGLARFGSGYGAAFERVAFKPVFLTEPDSPAIQTLLSSYREVFHDDKEPFAMGGGTYARCFPVGASFGPNRPWTERPAWAGEEHMADEAVSEDVLKDAFRVYVRTLYRLEHLEW